MPDRLLHDSGNAIAAALADAGLRCGPGSAAHDRLKNLIFRIKPPKHIRSVARSGWHRIDDDDVFVLPSGEVFGKNVEIIVQTAGVKTGEFTRASGTLADWQHNIARLAVGNSRVAFGISMAFAGPLLDVVGEKSGGFNARGESQIGKTYGIAETAASVCGRADSKGGFIHAWNTTQNALEVTCAETCDLTLILDELGQAEKKNLESTIYQIFNESGKSRMARTADQNRPQHSWRLLVLSTGEKSVEQHLASLGIKPPAGVGVRLLSFDADAGKGFGVYEKLHEFADGAALSRHFNEVCQRYYGTAIRAFLGRLADERAAIRDEIKGRQAAFRDKVLPAGGAGQAISVAMRFGLVAAAGELATRYGVTGWRKGEATRAAKTCFEAWLGKRGGVGPEEERVMVEQVRSLLERYGESRFIKFGPFHD